MLRIALRSLLFDRGKMFSALAGVSISATLAVAQIAIYYGFMETASAAITHTGGDIWVMAKGASVLDNAQPLSAGSRRLLASHPCVGRVRGFIIAFVPGSLGGGAEEGVQLVGVESVPDAPMPWSIAEGLPGDLADPLQISIDELDFAKLHVTGNPVGEKQISLGGLSSTVAVVTRGIHTFALAPQIFTNLVSARRMLGMKEGQAHYWIADLRNPSCVEDVRSFVRGHPDLEAKTTAEFAKITEDFWVGGSGAGAVLAFGAVLGLVVGCVIVAQTLYSITRDRLAELATLKALGATRGEIVSFVLWQSGLLALVGGTVAIHLAFLIAWGGRGAGIDLVVSPQVLAIGVGSVIAMCGLASVSSVRSVLALDAAEVFK